MRTGTTCPKTGASLTKGLLPRQKAKISRRTKGPCLLAQTRDTAAYRDIQKVGAPPIAAGRVNVLCGLTAKLALAGILGRPALVVGQGDVKLRPKYAQYWPLPP